MTKQGLWRSAIITMGVIVVVLVAGYLAVTLWLGSGDAPDEFSATAATDPSESGDAGASDEAGEADAVQDDGVDLDGTWSVSLDGQPDAGVGYRILEDLPVGGPAEVVARTQQVTGSIDISGGELTAAAVEVQMGGLESGVSLRDDIVASNHLEVDQYPTASLAITDPAAFDLPDAPGVLTAFDVPAELTIHGVTQSVEVTGEGQIAGEDLEIVGQVDVTLSQFDIVRPDLAGRTARDDAVVEFKLPMQRDAA